MSTSVAYRTVAPAKVNATLVVGPVRAGDGRHELVSVMQSLSLVDDVVLRPRDGSGAPPSATGSAAAAATSPAGDEVHCPGVNGENLALRALTDFRAATGWDGPPLTIEIAKRIPVAAGMAGGSADAGAVLRLAARASGLGDDELLQRLAAGLGADVPHQLEPGLAVASGAGERLVRCAGVLPGAVVVVRAEVGLSTPAVYRRADQLAPPRALETLHAWRERIEQALTGPGGPQLPDALCVNDLQAAAVDLAPVVGEHLARLVAVGATRTMVCGSGPTVVGWFADAERASAAAARLRADGGDALVALPTAGAPVVPIASAPT